MQCQLVLPTGRCENRATDPLIIETESGERKIISVCESCAAQDKKMTEKCHHPEVTVIQYLYRPATRENPAERETLVQCCECGSNLDMHQVDENTIIYSSGE